MKPFAVTKIPLFVALVVGLMSLLAFRLIFYKGQQTRILEVDIQDYRSAPLDLNFNGVNPVTYTFNKKNDSIAISGAVGFVELWKPIDGVPHSIAFLTSGDKMTVTVPISLSKLKVAHVETFGEFAGFAFPRRKDTYVFTPLAGATPP